MSIPSDVQNLVIYFSIMLSLSIFMNILLLLFSGFSVIGALSTIYQLQYVMLLPLTDTHFDDKVLYLYRGLNFLM